MLQTLLAQTRITNPVITDTALVTGSGGDALAIILARLFRVLMILGGLALLLYMAWGGISWITAGGDSGKIELARDKISNAVIGMAILVAVVAVAMLLSYTFGFDLLNPVVPGTPLP